MDGVQNATGILWPYHSMVDVFLGEPENQLNAESDDVCSDNVQHFDSATYITMASASVSILGSFLIILTFALWKDIRTVARAIVVFLAVADFLTAAGYLFGSIVYLHYKVLHNGTLSYSEYSAYDKMCTAQSFITTVGPVSSFLWTSHLAIYLFVSISLQRGELAKKLVIPFHITAWGIPLLFCIPALVLGELGPASSRTSTSWCFISYNSTYPGSDKEFRKKLVEFYAFEFICGKLWEILAYIIALVLYVAVKVSVWRRKQPQRTQEYSYGSLNMDRRVTAAYTHFDQKLIWIPIVFILLRIWGTTRFFISFMPSCHHPQHDCTPEMIVIEHHCQKYLYNPALVILQSIGDPAQGWGNALLFVFFNRTIMKRLCPCCFVLCEKLRPHWFSFCNKVKASCHRCCKKDQSGDEAIIFANDQAVLVSSNNNGSSQRSSFSVISVSSQGPRSITNQ